MKVWPTQDEEGKFKKEIWLVKCGQNRLRNQRPNQTRSNGKMPQPDRKISLLGVKDQMKLVRRRSLYHKVSPPCDLSDLYVIKPVFSTDVG
jgi:hypothetical protein